MTNKPVVSVIINTYNHKNYISQAIDSVLTQKTTFPFEIIVGEDESKDGTREICIEYENKHPDIIRLFLRSRKDVIYINGHPTARFNIIENFKKAKGKYIALLPGDDFWTDPYKLQKQIDFLESNPDFSLAGHQVIVVDKIGKESGKIAGAFGKDNYSFEEVGYRNLRIPTASLVYKNQIVLPEWFKSVYGGDRALIYLNAQKGKLKILDFIGAAYRVHRGGVEQKYKKDKFSMPVRNVKENEIYLKILPPNLKRKLHRNSGWNYSYLSVQYLRKLNVLKSIVNLVKALHHYIRAI